LAIITTEVKSGLIATLNRI